MIALVPVVGTSLAIAGGAHTKGARVLAWQPLTAIGDRSYSWYLWHWPAIVAANGLWPTHTWVPVLAAGLALGPAWLSYRQVETPLRRDARFTGGRVVGLLVTCIALSLAAACGLRLVSAREAAETPRGARARRRNRVRRLTSRTLCASRWGEPVRDGVWLYRDAGHLSVAGALTLTDPLEQAISASARR